jgi:hypothetical protein
VPLPAHPREVPTERAHNAATQQPAGTKQIGAVVKAAPDVRAPTNDQVAHDFHGVWDLESMRKGAEKNPDEVVICRSVYTTSAVCYAATAFVADNYQKLKPSAGDAFVFVNECGRLPRATCLMLLEEMRNLSRKIDSQSTYVSIDECADRFTKKSSGGDRLQYLNLCQQLAAYFR